MRGPVTDTGNLAHPQNLAANHEGTAQGKRVGVAKRGIVVGDIIPCAAVVQVLVAGDGRVGHVLDEHTRHPCGRFKGVAVVGLSVDVNEHQHLGVGVAHGVTRHVLNHVTVHRASIVTEVVVGGLGALHVGVGLGDVRSAVEEVGQDIVIVV